MKEENEKPTAASITALTFPTDPPKIERTLRELISAICSDDLEGLEQLMAELKDAAVQKITLQEIVGHQLMQKVHFVERHLPASEWNAGIVRKKRELLTQIWKAELQDPSRIRRNYEKD